MNRVCTENSWIFIIYRTCMINICEMYIKHNVSFPCYGTPKISLVIHRKTQQNHLVAPFSPATQHQQIQESNLKIVLCSTSQHILFWITTTLQEHWNIRLSVVCEHEIYIDLCILCSNRNKKETWIYRLPS